MIFLSIIIPCYNSQDTILPLLTSIAYSRNVNFEEIEVIVVDDKSKDQTIPVVQKYLDNIDKVKEDNSLDTLKSFKIISLKKNSGPAQARNIGAKYAEGKVVLFLDSDVVVYRNTLFEIIRSFRDDPDLHALTGVWDKRQRSKKFFPKFKALRDWSYWINERDPRNYYYLFSTRIAAIDRELFLRLGGFDTTYKTALIEDIELTYRIARRYAVVFNSKAKVHHEFEDFFPIARKYFWRSFYWSRIYRERKKFDPVATTGKEALTTISAGLLVGLSFIYIISSVTYYMLGVKDGVYIAFQYSILNTLYAVLLVHLWGVRKFLRFCIKEEGLWFSLKAFFTGIVLYVVILAGAGASLIHSKSQISHSK